MASPWTIPKLVTWRVKDWASCFLACKFPLEEEDRVSNNNIITSNNNYTFKRGKKKMMKSKRRERRLSLSPPPTRHFQHLRNTTSSRSCSVSPAGNRRLSWPQPPTLSDDAFIVFCFDRDDGRFEVVQEGSKPDDRSPRSVNRKLTFGDEEVGTEKKNSDEKGTEEDKKNHNSSCPGYDNKLIEESEEINVSGGSSGSNHSDGVGRGSFAFPILGAEWIGSPVQMPKSDDLCLKKQKALAVGFQCCRF